MKHVALDRKRKWMCLLGIRPATNLVMGVFCTTTSRMLSSSIAMAARRRLSIIARIKTSCIEWHRFRLSGSSRPTLASSLSFRASRKWPSTCARTLCATSHWLVSAALWRAIGSLVSHLNSYHRTGWQHSVVGFHQILPFIEQLLVEIHGKSHDRIRQSGIDPRGSAVPFRDLIALWRDKKAGASRDAWRPYLSELNGGSFQWTRPIRGHRRLEIVEVGTGMPRCAQRWLSHARLLSLDDHPDPHYANYCRQTYWSVAERGEASLDTLDLMVDWPTFGLTRRRFHRVLLPVDTDEGQLLLGASLLDETIDLRRP